MAYSKKINVLARVLVSIPEADLELGLGWKPAADAKREAADWLGDLDPDVLPEEITVRVVIDQRSDDDPFVSHAEDIGREHKAFALEYAAKFLEAYPNWGRGR